MHPLNLFVFISDLSFWKKWFQWHFLYLVKVKNLKSVMCTFCPDNINLTGHCLVLVALGLPIFLLTENTGENSALASCLKYYTWFTNENRMYRYFFDPQQLLEKHVALPFSYTGLMSCQCGHSVIKVNNERIWLQSGCLQYVSVVM